MAINWSLGVLPGNATGIAARARNRGAHANGLSNGHANGLYLCLHHPKLPTLGVVLTHDEGGDSSPSLKSGGFSPSIPHHLGSPRSQCLSGPASMGLGGGQRYCWLR